MPIEKNSRVRLQHIDRLLRRTFGDALTKEQILQSVNERLHEEGIKPITDRQLTNDFKKLSDQCSEVATKKVNVNGFFQSVRYYRDDSAPDLFEKEITETQREDLKKVIEIISGFRNLGPWVDEIIVSLKSQFAIRTRDEAIMESLPVLLDDNPDYIGLENLNDLLKAIKDEKALLIHYKPFSEDVKKIDFHPHIIKRYNQRWFCLGLEDSSGQLINLALDRIGKIERSKKTYIPSDLSLQEWRDKFEEIIGVTFPKEQEAVKLKIKVTDKTQWYIETKPIHPTQKATKGSDYTIFTYELIPNFEMYQLLLAYREFLEVLEPPVVRDEMKNIVLKMADNYTRE